MPTSSRSLRVLATPRPVEVELDGDGVPVGVGGRAVEAVREEWHVEEGWWTDAPVRRRYFEVVLSGGRVATVFQDLRAPDRWYAQRA